ILAEHGRGLGEVDFPMDIVVDKQGNLYVADWQGNRIQCRSADGKWTVIAKAGQWYGEVNGPVSLAIAPDGTLYVGEGNRIQRRSPSGRWTVVATNGSGRFQVGGTPYGLATGPNGELYIADTGNNRVILYPSPCRTGDLNNDGEVTISDVILLLRLSVLGESPQSPNPTRVGDIDRDGKISVADVTKLLNHLVKGTPLPPE
ncbi:MAG: dockerin type I domain-containing protein, partial [Armatimonadota bacterium]